jgi:hypothetical protein
VRPPAKRSNVAAMVLLSQYIRTRGVLTDAELQDLRAGLRV